MPEGCAVTIRLHVNYMYMLMVCVSILSDSDGRFECSYSQSAVELKKPQFNTAARISAITAGTNTFCITTGGKPMNLLVHVLLFFFYSLWNIQGKAPTCMF